jgi:hypothetical protein
MIVQKYSLQVLHNNINYMPFKSKAQRRWMYAKHPKMAKKWQKHTPKNAELPEHVKENFDSVAEQYLRLYLFDENYPATAQANSGQVDPARMNSANVNPTAGMPAINAQGNNPQAFKQVKPNNAPKQAPPRLDPKFLNALKQSHDPNNPNPAQTEQNVRQLMSQPNAPMIDQNSNEYALLPPEVQTALQKHSNEVAQKNNYQNNIKQNAVKQPPQYQNQKQAPPTANYMPQQAQRPPQSQGSVGGVV